MIEKTCKTCYHNYHKGHTNGHCPHTLMCHEHDKWIPCTNREYLESLSDEEFAKWLWDHGLYHVCAKGKDYCMVGKDGIIEWMGLPVSEEFHNV